MSAAVDCENPILLPSAKPGGSVMIEGEYGPRYAAQLLGLLLLQAMTDRMGFIRIGVDTAAGRSHMRYGRLDGAGREESWEMVAPPAELFPFLLQYLMSVTKLEPSFPIHGTAVARKGDNRIQLSVAFDTSHGFEIRWPTR